MLGVTVTQLIKSNHFKNMIPEIDTDNVIITVPDVSRPALPLTGFFAHFNNDRIQLIGNAEQEYIGLMSQERKEEIFDRLCRYKIPAIIFSNNLQPDAVLMQKCLKYGIPCIVTHQTSGELFAELIRWLQTKLAPRISIHGVLVDVYGEGILIKGDSGVGKSEAALELIKRGHRLVADDAVEILRTSVNTIIGQSPQNIRHFIELRGIGIINARQLFGMGAIKTSEKIAMTAWDSTTSIWRFSALRCPP